MRARLLGAIGLCCWLTGPLARAQPAGPLRVQRSAGAESCPDAARLWERASQLGAQPREGLAVEVELERTPEGFSASLRLAGSDTERRRLQDPGPDCAPLAEAVSVALAILLAPIEAPPPPPPRSPPRPVEQRLWVGLGAGGALGLTEQAAALGLLSGDFQRGAWGAGLDLSYAPERDHPAGSGQVAIAVGGAALRGCYRAAGPGAGPALELCAGPSLRLVTARGEGFAPDRQARRLSPAVGASVGGYGPLTGRLGWGVRLGAFAPLREETLSVEGLGVIHRTPRAGAALTLHLRWSIL